MKTLLFISILAFTNLSFAQVEGGSGPGNSITNSVMNCEVLSSDGLMAKNIRLESTSETFNMMSSKKLIVDVFGKDEVFTLTAKSTSGDSSKLDYQLDAHPSQVKAVLLLDRAYGKVTKKMKALLVITGVNVNFAESSGASFYNAGSLVYNISCSTEN